MDTQNVGGWGFNGIAQGLTGQFGSQTVVYSGVTNVTNIANT